MKRNLAPYLFAFLLAVDIATLGFAVAVKNQQDNTVNALRAGLVKSCVNNGNPLRVAVQKQLRDEIQQSSNVKLYEQFFPTISHAQLVKLIATQNAQRHAEIKQIAPVDCTALYR